MSSQAIAIVAALRVGIPPEEGVEQYSVGRSTVLEEFHRDLDRVAAGQSALQYISADIGQGKTHLLRLLRHEAFGRDFVVSEVQLSASQCPLFELVDVYRHIMLGLRTRDSPTEPALEAVLDRWLHFQRSAATDVRVRSLARLPSDLQAALLSYLSATNFLRPSAPRRDSVLRWLIGERLLRAQRDPLELYSNISDHNALAMLDAITGLFRDIGYGGVCILFDEAESMVSFSRSAQRERAVANLTRIVRAAESAVGCYFVYATTPSFVDSYASRPEFHARNDDGIVLSLDPLSADDTLLLVSRLVDLYLEAYPGSVPVAAAAKISKTVQSRSADRTSDVTKAIIATLDELRDGANGA